MYLIKEFCFSLFLDCPYKVSITLWITHPFKVVDVVRIGFINIAPTKKKYQ